jgi:hypothetical protein
MTSPADFFRKYMDILKEAEVTAVDELNGFKNGDKIAITDAAASPPQIYKGTIKQVYSDNTAHVTLDHDIAHAVEQRLKNNGRVDLHNAKVI